MRTRDKEVIQEIPCPICGNKFMPQKVFQKFCSVSCRTKFHNHKNKKPST